MIPAYQNAKARGLISDKRARIFRLGEILGSFIVSLMLAISFGFFETNVQQANPVISNLVIFGHFSFWHLAMCLMVFGVGLGSMMFSLLRGKIFAAFAVAIADVLVFATVEDMAWFLFRYQWVNSSAWSTWNLGGVAISGTFIPFVYMISLISAALLYGAAYFL